MKMRGVKHRKGKFEDMQQKLALFFFESNPDSFPKRKKMSSNYNLQLSFFKHLLDITPKAYTQRSMPC